MYQKLTSDTLNNCNDWFGLDIKTCIPAESSEYDRGEAITLLNKPIPWDLMTVFPQVIKHVCQNI